MRRGAVYFFVGLSLVCQFSPVFSSVGDSSPLYQTCVRRCMQVNCTDDGDSFNHKALENLDTGVSLLGWSCRDDCRYGCMWRTVHAFRDRGYPVPKFHGKWPFKRLFGIQEPASTLFSILNMAAHIYMFLRIRRDPRFSVSETPMLMFYHVFVAVCVHGWMWSTIFHARDTPLTEFMDYACALMMVMALFVAAVFRVLRGWRVAPSLIATVTLWYYMEHARYLYTGFDYSYNMLVNLSFGVTGSVLWLLHAMAALHRDRRYAWQMAAFVLLSALGLTLELYDFPPIAGMDAHALWHLSTAPLPLLYYRFVIDDMDYLQTVEMVERKFGGKTA